MPKLEPRDIQKELEQEMLWPVYWVYGAEPMKVRELLKRIRTAVFGEGTDTAFSEDLLDGGEIDADEILHAADSLGFMFGGSANALRLVVVRDAHQVKNLDLLLPLLKPRAKRAELTSVLVLLAKDLDQRKKFSKALLEKAAVVECAPVADADREAWIVYLAKRRGMTVDQSFAIQLLTLEPWNLDTVDQELEKRFLLGQDQAERDPNLPGSIADARQLLQSLSDRFLQAFFSRKSAPGLSLAEEIASQPQEAIPLLGLLAWNVRQLLSLVQAEAEKKSAPPLRVPPFVLNRLKAWAAYWKLEELLELQHELYRVDFQTKQTPLHPLGMWSHLIQRFGRG